ncbi:hypothetical protein BLNAU_6938 [Blattamonas nauphoetae]|uniref:Uncharacterized protein n=1 Tax=Blattamonas nauphoetae TaxID=2049346 RepID=A0ABQ9Y2P2_9EUKA|nr:hypothetical protein BLNAU_6938 [Blattamonas nauphoetae]
MNVRSCCDLAGSRTVLRDGKRDAWEALARRGNAKVRRFGVGETGVVASTVDDEKKVWFDANVMRRERRRDKE